MSEMQVSSVENIVNDDHLKVINNKIEKLRLKLLDLTRRNPLISVNLSDKSTSNIRVVDEILSILFKEIQSSKMRIVSLPSLEDELKDESTREFRNALSEALINDEIYLRETEAINQNDEKSADLQARAERSLKDRIREKLKMPVRQTKASLSIQQHARNHDINPHYDLPLEHEKHDDGRHNDKDIQTLFLPDALERKLNALALKDKTWKEEVGINVLYAGFGFLEWKESGNSEKSSFSPLVLLPIELEKKKSGSGQEFWISAEDAIPEWNMTLAEKLRLDYGVLLPKYEEGQSIEDYFAQVESQSPKGMDWKLRRWVVVGVFPSAKLAMYHDLDVKNGWGFLENPTISSLFGGASDAQQEATAFGDEYNVDDPKIEAKVPLLVTDADSSQFSTIADVLDGKNLAVEGPPGTGKSQTIVNTIAAALAQGKKVMFVAEKSAALEVVKSRLESFGLGHFLLPLQATRSSKEQVISSIRDRIEAKFPESPRELEELKKTFDRTRNELASYIQVLASVFGGSGYKVYQILGRAISLRDVIDSSPEDLQNYSVPIPQNITKSESEDIIALLRAAENAWIETQKNEICWKGVKVANIDTFSADEILKAADKAAHAYLNTVKIRDELKSYKVSVDAETSLIETTNEIAKALPRNLSNEEIAVLENLDTQSALDDVEKFLINAENIRSGKDEIREAIKDPFSTSISEEVNIAAGLVEKHGFQNLLPSELRQRISKLEGEISGLKETMKSLSEASGILEPAKEIAAKYIIAASKIITDISRDVILLRGENLIDPAAKLIIEKAQKHVASLQEQRDSIKAKISLDTSIKKGEVSSSISVLESAGIFAIFSGQYRQAKKFYNRASKGNKFNKSEALNNLKNLEFYLVGIEELNSNQKLQSLLGLRFDGIETRFEPYAELFSFYAAIDSELSHPSCASLKGLLRSSNSDALFSFPKINKDHPANSFSDVSEKSGEALLSDLSSSLNELKNDVSYIDKVAENFCKKEDWDAKKMIALSDKIKDFQMAWKKSGEDNSIKKILVDKFNGPETKREDVEHLVNVASKIVNLNLRVSVIEAMKLGKLKEFCDLMDQILVADKSALDVLEKLSQLTNTKTEVWSKNKTYEMIANDMKSASQDKAGLIAYSYLVGITNDISERGYRDFLYKVVKNYTPPCDIGKIFRAVLARSAAQEVYKKYGSILSRFNGIKLSSLRKQLAEVDVKIIELSRQYLQSKLSKSAYTLQGTKGSGRRSEYTEMEMLRHQIALTRGYAPMREITRRAGKSLLELKPCWMMSPLAVANFIPKDSIEFDLLIIDEASQMTPENAVGALLRTKQVMVVGDVNQLPPTNFFGKTFDTEEEEDEDVTTEASILEMASAVFSPRRRLKWHYRSRHSGLISFSNKYVYDNDLVVFPSANESAPEMGVSYRKVDGLYSSGVNPEEAKVMVDAIMDFMTKYPDQSLGVVVLNQKQATLLNDEMDFAFEKNPLAVEYKEKWQSKNNGLEYFFIKNLENVQGDERDVIFIGTVYGREKIDAPVMQRFGPINGAAGRRRLNVLFSRAKRRMVTFSSMNSSDIKAEEDGNQGAYMLKQWLEYCASGRIHGGNVKSYETDSEFEDHVIYQLRSIGCDAIPQIGVVGYSIDIGVKHPDWPHGFIMGVECDGATYHSSKSARDRDRLRQQVLEGLGWNLYRIWSTDWFDDPIRETEKLREAVKIRVSYLKNNQM